MVKSSSGQADCLAYWTSECFSSGTAMGSPWPPGSKILKCRAGWRERCFWIDLAEAIPTNIFSSSNDYSTVEKLKLVPGSLGPGFSFRGRPGGGWVVASVFRGLAGGGWVVLSRESVHKKKKTCLMFNINFLSFSSILNAVQKHRKNID